jgi:cytochrome P450
VRDDVVSMLAASTETTATALTWLWVALDSRPGVASTFYSEIDQVVGSGPVNASHVSGLRYTRMVLEEILRLYPVGWLLPRKAKRRDVIDGHSIKRGATVLVSPYLTHRLEEFWARPNEFDPERFRPDQTQRRHQFSYFPFGSGLHKCPGSHLFMVEAALIIATILSRYRPRLCNTEPVTPRPAASLRPRQRVEMVLRPIAPGAASLDCAA